MLTKQQIKPIAKVIKENIGTQKFVLMVIDTENANRKNNTSIMSNLKPDRIPFFLNEILDETTQINNDNVTTFNPYDND